jgi:hypothetical protein
MRPLSKTPDYRGPDGKPRKLLLDEYEAADYTGLSVSYLRKSRCTGKSIRNPRTRQKTKPPRFVEVDGLIRYRSQDLNAWVLGLESEEVI